jgi:hypothetical protein
LLTITALQLGFRISHQEGPRSKGLKLNGTHRYLACADDVDLFVENINVTKKEGTLLITCRKVGLEVNV